MKWRNSHLRRPLHACKAEHLKLTFPMDKVDHRLPHHFSLSKLVFVMYLCNPPLPPSCAILHSAGKEIFKRCKPFLNATLLMRLACLHKIIHYNIIVGELCLSNSCNNASSLRDGRVGFGTGNKFAHTLRRARVLCYPKQILKFSDISCNSSPRALQQLR